jgi:hypothetical protein
MTWRQTKNVIRLEIATAQAPVRKKQQNRLCRRPCLLCQNQYEGIRLKRAIEKNAAESTGKGGETRGAITGTYRKEVRERSASKHGNDPFAVFSEWASEADDKAYSGL